MKSKNQKAQPQNKTKQEELKFTNLSLDLKPFTQANTAFLLSGTALPQKKHLPTLFSEIKDYVQVWRYRQGIYLACSSWVRSLVSPRVISEHKVKTNKTKTYQNFQRILIFFSHYHLHHNTILFTGKGYLDLVTCYLS